MKKIVLILSLLTLSVVTYSQDVKVGKYYVGINYDGVMFNNWSWRNSYYKGSNQFAFQFEATIDSSLQSTVINFSTYNLKSKDNNLTKDVLSTNLQLMGRTYLSKRKFWRVYTEGGIVMSDINDKPEVGFVANFGWNLYSFDILNLYLQAGFVFQTGEYIYRTVKFGVNFKLD